MIVANPAVAPVAPRRFALTLPVAFSIFGIVLLILAEILATVGSAVWAVAGLLHLTLVPTLVFATLLTVPAVVASYRFARAVIRVELAG